MPNHPITSALHMTWPRGTSTTVTNDVSAVNMSDGNTSESTPHAAAPGQRSLFRPLNLSHRLVTRERGDRLDLTAIKESLAPKLRNPPAIAARRLVIMAMPTSTEAERHAKLHAMCDARAGLLPPDCDLQRIMASGKKVAILCDNAILEAIAMMHDEGKTIRMAPFEALDDPFVPFKDGDIDFYSVLNPILGCGNQEAFPHAPEQRPAINAMRQLLECGIFNAYVGESDWSTFTWQYLTDHNREKLAKACDYSTRDLLDNIPRSLLVDTTGEAPRMGPIGGQLFEHTTSYSRSDLLNDLLASPAGRAFDAPLPSGRRPIDHTWYQYNFAATDRLLEYGASLGEKSPYPHRALELFVSAARASRSLEAVQSLCKHGLAKYMNRRDENGNNVLHLVVPHIGKKALRYLLDHGAHTLIDMPNAAGKTPITTALLHRRHARAKMLAEYEPHRAAPSIMPGSAKSVPKNLPQLLLQRELNGNLSRRHQIQAPHIGTPVSEERLELRQAILEMPTNTATQRRSKLIAMTDPRAGLLPADTDIERILNSPAKTELLCCDRELQHSIERMVDGRHTIRMEPLYAMAERFVPVANGRLDLAHLYNKVNDALASELENPGQALHPALVAFKQVSSTGLLNGYVGADNTGDVSNGDLLPVRLLCDPDFVKIFGRHMLLEVLRNTPDALLRFSSTEPNSPVPLLLVAAAHSDLEVIKTLIARGVSCNVIGENYMTAFMAAVHNDNVELIKLLLANGGARTINMPTFLESRWDAPTSGDPTWVTPVYMATVLGATASVEILLKHGALQCLESSDAREPTPLHEAAWDNRVKIAELLLQFGGSQYLTYRDGAGRTPLHIAVDKGHIDVLRLLLENGGAAHVNGRDVYTDRPRGIYHEPLTPLMRAVYLNNPEAVKLLLKHVPTGCLESTDEHGKTAMAIAEKFGRHEIIAMLKQAGAADKAHPDKARIVGQYGGGDPAFKAHQELWIACITGDRRTAEALLTEGAPHDWVTLHGSTLLHVMIQPPPPFSDLKISSRASIIDLLVDSCPSSIKEKKNRRGETPYALARRFDYPEYVAGRLKPDNA